MFETSPNELSKAVRIFKAKFGYNEKIDNDRIEEIILAMRARQPKKKKGK